MDKEYVINKVIKKMISLSVNPDEYYNEWSGLGKIETSYKRCVCGKGDLLYTYGLQNKFTSKILIIGSKCIITVSHLIEKKYGLTSIGYEFDKLKKLHNRITNRKVRCKTCKCIINYSSFKKHLTTKKHITTKNKLKQNL